MKKISIQLYFGDEQYDVLVFDEKGMNDEELTDYAFQTKKEAEKYIEQLNQSYDVIGFEEINEETMEDTFDIDSLIKPHYLTYVIDDSQLKPTLEELFYRRNGFRIPISVVFDSEYIYINLDESASEKIKQRMENLYGKGAYFADEILNDAFGAVGVRYSVPMEDFAGVHILVPYKEKRMR